MATPVSQHRPPYNLAPSPSNAAAVLSWRLLAKRHALTTRRLRTRSARAGPRPRVHQLQSSAGRQDAHRQAQAAVSAISFARCQRLRERATRSGRSEQDGRAGRSLAAVIRRLFRRLSVLAFAPGSSPNWTSLKSSASFTRTDRPAVIFLDSSTLATGLCSGAGDLFCTHSVRRCPVDYGQMSSMRAGGHQLAECP